MSTGDIRNGPYATRAKEYVWSTLREVFPRGITPTDIDGLVEINHCFFVFEGKTEGKTVDVGQALCLKRAVLDWPHGRAVFVLAEHRAMDRVDVATGLRSVQFAWRPSGSAGRLQWSSKLPAYGLWEIASLFVRDAEAGRLHPETWEAEWNYACRPFEEPA